MMPLYFGIDPGLRNLGLAARTAKQELEALHVALSRGSDVLVALSSIAHFIKGHMPKGRQPLEGVTVAVEDYASFGGVVRKNYGPMKELIGAIRGWCWAECILCVLVQPREKEQAKLARPAGQEDHAYDARAIAWLAMKKQQGGTAPRSKASARAEKS